MGLADRRRGLDMPFATHPLEAGLRIVEAVAPDGRRTLWLAPDNPSGPDGCACASCVPTGIDNLAERRAGLAGELLLAGALADRARSLAHLDVAWLAEWVRVMPIPPGDDELASTRDRVLDRLGVKLNPHPCAGITTSGRPCRRTVYGDRTHCQQHNGLRCGAPTAADGRPCRQPVDEHGARCRQHAHHPAAPTLPGLEQHTDERTAR